MTDGARLRKAREAKGLTQKQAARLCEVDERTYQRWESGATKRIRSWAFECMRKAKKRGA